MNLERNRIKRNRKEYIEDITCPRADMNFIFEWSTRYLTSERSERVRYRVEHEKIKFISISEYVIFCLLYNTSEIPNQLAFKGVIYYVTITTVISSRVKITCLLIFTCEDMKFSRESSLGISLVFV